MLKDEALEVLQSSADMAARTEDWLEYAADLVWMYDTRPDHMKTWAQFGFGWSEHQARSRVSRARKALEAVKEKNDAVTRSLRLRNEMIASRKLGNTMTVQQFLSSSINGYQQPPSSLSFYRRSNGRLVRG